MEPIANASPRVFRPKFVSRMVGAGYLLMIASGFDLFYVLAKLYVRGDAAVTAANIKAHEALFFAGFAGALIGVALPAGQRDRDVLPALRKRPAARESVDGEG